MSKNSFYVSLFYTIAVSNHAMNEMQRKSSIWMEYSISFELGLYSPTFFKLTNFLTLFQFQEIQSINPEKVPSTNTGSNSKRNREFSSQQKQESTCNKHKILQRLQYHLSIFLVFLASSGWQECFDDNTGYPYYWHTETNEVTWDMPDELKMRNPPQESHHNPYLPPWSKQSSKTCKTNYQFYQ